MAHGFDNHQAAGRDAFSSRRQRGDAKQLERDAVGDAKQAGADFGTRRKGEEMRGAPRLTIAQERFVKA